MSTDQRASERVGELIHHVFESLLQANTDFERLQDLLGLGMDSKQLLTPHSQMTWKFMAPQEEKFRENWKKFVSAMQGAESSPSQSQPVVVETVDSAPAPLPAITVLAAEGVIPATQTENTPDPIPDPEPDLTPGPMSQVSTLPTPASSTPILVTVKEEAEQSHHLPPSGSVDNPMEIDDSDDEIIVQRSTSTPKRKKIAPPAGKEAPGKRSRLENNCPSGSKDPTLGTTSQTQVVSVNVAGPPEKPVLSGGYKWKPHRDAKLENYGQKRELLHHRLDQLGPPLDVDRSRLTHDSFLITRMDISAIYGGEAVSSFPKIGKLAQTMHPYRNFCHGNFDHNPFLPPEPGWPGLFFRLDENNDHCDAEGNPIVYRTFARHADKRCVYVGQYTFTKLEDISKHEWRELPEKTKTIWLGYFGGGLLANRSLARIALRASLKKEPTEAQLAAKYKAIESRDVRRRLAEELQKAIRKAFNHGEERIVVWGMKCVSYDYDFESDLAIKWKALDNTTPRESGGGRKQPKAQQKRRGRAKKKQEVVSDYTEDEDDTPTSASRGHLSRKARGEALKKPPVSGGGDSAREELTDDEDYHDAM